MGKLDRKMRRSAQKINPNEYINETIVRVVAVAAEVVHDDWGKMKNKEQRVSVFVNLLIEGLLKIDEPSALRQSIEQQLRKMVMV